MASTAHCARQPTGLIVGRLAHPASERETHRWLAQDSALGELLGVDYESMGAMQLYRASDALVKHRDAIEAHLYERAMVERFCARYEAALTKLALALSNPRARRKPEQINQRLGRLKAQHRRVAGYYSLDLTVPG